MELAILICVLAALILFLAPEKKKKKTNFTLIVAVGFAGAFVFLQSLARAMAQQRADKTNNSAWKQKKKKKKKWVPSAVTEVPFWAVSVGI